MLTTLPILLSLLPTLTLSYPAGKILHPTPTGPVPFAAALPPLPPSAPTYSLSPAQSQTITIVHSGINYCSSPGHCTWLRTDDIQNHCHSFGTKYRVFIPDRGVSCSVYGNDMCYQKMYGDTWKVSGVTAQNPVLDTVSDARFIAKGLGGGIGSFVCVDTKK